MLIIYKAARTQALLPVNIESGFRATSLVPYDLDSVLSKLEIRP